MPIKELNEIFAIGDENVYSSPIAELFGKLFHSVDTAKLIHLSTKSYEVHVATEIYYTDIVGLIDSLIECYQGMYGILSIKIPSSCACDAVSYFQETLNNVQIGRKLFKDTNLQNTIDEIISLLANTLYRLRFLQ